MECEKQGNRRAALAELAPLVFVLAVLRRRGGGSAQQPDAPPGGAGPHPRLRRAPKRHLQVA
eukprot:scaffold24750_cov38-Prasinocladus_malaysianus.AAC.1